MRYPLSVWMQFLMLEFQSRQHEPSDIFVAEEVRDQSRMCFSVSWLSPPTVGLVRKASRFCLFKSQASRTVCFPRHQAPDKQLALANGFGPIVAGFRTSGYFRGLRSGGRWV